MRQWREEILVLRVGSVRLRKKTSGHEDRRESIPYITDKALNIQL